MDSVSLMRRVDTKFLLHRNQLKSILEELQSNYSALEIKDERIMTYYSQYYDTDQQNFYLDHHNGRANRTKIRIRNYLESKLFFLEVKQKNAKGQTSKYRIPIDNFETNLSKKSTTFIKSITAQDYNLQATIKNKFNRITLVNKSIKERATVDFNISLCNSITDKTFENLVIIEVKQEAYNNTSPFIMLLKSNNIYPTKISKYCLGMLGLHEGLKYNNFKPTLLKINKIKT